jgi:hypothetical protein
MATTIDRVFEGDQLRSEQINSVARKLIPVAPSARFIRARLSLGIMSAIAFVVNIVIGLPSLSQTTTPRPCDIYGNAGTPCVAVHSMTRALYAAYNGPLYQVQRSSDNATQDIGLLSAGGYANAATQNSFCSGTTCKIVKIYDQSPNHNDLRPYYTASQANLLPVTISGHNVYGLKITPVAGHDWAGNAYGRHTADGGTTGMPTGAQPEGTYMVTSGKDSLTGDCCFDYGNTEMNIADNGNGTMDAIGFGNYCWFPTCLGTGPWVQDDLENGVYSSDVGTQNNPANTGDTFQFVTAMIKNNGTTLWARRSGNAQSGGLTTWFSGPLPSATFTPCCRQPPGPYSPMRKEGGLTLGQGGDGSNRVPGQFFEGAVVSGYPSDSTDKAVQANIVSARYRGRHR